jgi:hypothetical protein
VCLLSSVGPPSGKLVIPARAPPLGTSAAAVGLVFMGVIVVSVFLVPTLTLALGLAAQSRSARRAALPVSAPEPGQSDQVQYAERGPGHGPDPVRPYQAELRTFSSTFCVTQRDVVPVVAGSGTMPAW